MADYHRVFSPLNIGRLTIPNRIIMPALHLVYCEGGEVNEQLISFYVRRAEAGLLIVGGCSIDELGYSYRMIGMHNEKFRQGLSRLTKGIHEAGGRVAAQLFQSGRYAKSAVTGRPGIAPSPVYSKYSREIPEVMTKEHIDMTIENYTKAASLAVASGFDAIEILAGTGYLISEFLSPVTNLREDEFGGSMENRFRFPGMILDAVRKEVGKDIPIIVRIAGNDFIPGGNGIWEAVAFAQFCEEHGADAVNVTGGWHETNIPQLTGHLPKAGFGYLAAAVKDGVSIPVFASNRINSLEVAEQLLATEAADGICMGRQLVCDPDTIRKAREKRVHETIPCVACGQGCIEHTFQGKPLGCALNPESGNEHRLTIEKTGSPKEILVIGGGPAGMTAAVVAGKRGHKVTLYEQESCLGGRLRVLKEIKSKQEYGRLLQSLEHLLTVYGVKICLNQKYTEVLPGENKFDEIIVATGAFPTTSVETKAFQGTVCNDEDVLCKRVIPGRQVVILGSGGLELETATHLKQKSGPSPELLEFLIRHKGESAETIEKLRSQGRRNISVITKAEKPAAHIGTGERWAVLKEAAQYGVSILCGAQEVHIVAEGVVVELSNGNRCILPADTIITTNRKSNCNWKTFGNSFSGNIHVVGDAKRIGSKAYVIGGAAGLTMSI
ncbi:FAD-dependent oxidoreductase [Lachnospiraceae bacterium OttesenSCG-928-D06]|nr:FAD-dependent oxidoreductase [Lachnospiraceae bacterium OttesenSCG-928-D06]